MLILPAYRSTMCDGLRVRNSRHSSHPRRSVFGKFVRKPNCSWSEVFVNRGLTVLIKFSSASNSYCRNTCHTFSINDRSVWGLRPSDMLSGMGCYRRFQTAYQSHFMSQTILFDPWRLRNRSATSVTKYAAKYPTGAVASPTQRQKPGISQSQILYFSC